MQSSTRLILKGTGNEKFKAGECGAAITAYQEAVDKLTSDAAKKALLDFFKSHPDATDSATPLLASLHLNMAACHIKSEQWESAEIAATAALKLDPTNVKAKFRRGIARSNLGSFDEAKTDLTAVCRAEPRNREARTVLEVCHRLFTPWQWAHQFKSHGTALSRRQCAHAAARVLWYGCSCERVG